MRIALAAVLGLAACNPYDSDYGASPFLCGPTEPRCPRGYTCVADNGRDVCYDDGSASGDGDCETDGGLEPNDALDAATPTGLDTMPEVAFDNLTICPGVDKDHYALTLAMTNGVEATVVVEPADVGVRAAILNATGIPIMTATPVDGSPGTIRVRAQNLPAGTYVVQVSGTGASLPDHHYGVTIRAGL